MTRSMEQILASDLTVQGDQIMGGISSEPVYKPFTQSNPGFTLGFNWINPQPEPPGSIGGNLLGK